jgi:hypothetical protein
MAEYKYKSPQDRAEERYQKRRKEEHNKLIIGIIVFVIVLAGTGIYRVWWWNNCAFHSYYDAPMLCHSNSAKK